MNNAFKKAASFVLAAAMSMSLAACGGGSSPTGSAAGSAGSATDSTAAKKVDTSEHVKLNMLVLGNKPTNGRMEAAIAEENKLLTKKVNAEISLQYIEWADWQSKYQLALSSGDGSVDLIVTATDWLYAWQSAKKGAFLPLDEKMLSTYAPQTYASVPKEDWKDGTKDGKIWFIPEDQYTQYTNHGFYYRGDWAKQAGIDKVTKFEDLEKYLAAVKKNHPDAVPWDVGAPNNLSGLYPGYIQSHTKDTVMLGTDVGNYQIFYYDNSNPYKAICPIMDSNEFVDFAKLMKKWGDAGYWRSDVLNYQGDTTNLMFAGKSGADQHHTQSYITDRRPNMDAKQPGSNLQFYYWGMENKNVNKDLDTHGAMAVSATSKNPERALMVYDLIRNDKDIYYLHNHGIEGKDYVMKDGKLDHPTGWDATKDALDTNFWAGRMDKYEPDATNWYSGKNDIYKELSSFAGKYALGKFAFSPDNVSSEIAAVADVCNTYIPSIAYGKAGDPTEAVNKFRQALKDAGYDKVLAEIQTQLDAEKTADAK